MTCPGCGTEMNHHADKLVERVDDPAEREAPLPGGGVWEVHACPACGNVESRPAPRLGS